MNPNLPMVDFSYLRTYLHTIHEELHSYAREVYQSYNPSLGYSSKISIREIHWDTLKKYVNHKVTFFQNALIRCPSENNRLRHFKQWLPLI